MFLPLARVLAVSWEERRSVKAELVTVPVQALRHPARTGLTAAKPLPFSLPAFQSLDEAWRRRETRVDHYIVPSRVSFCIFTSLSYFCTGLKIQVT